MVTPQKCSGFENRQLSHVLIAQEKTAAKLHEEFPFPDLKQIIVIDDERLNFNLQIVPDQESEIEAHSISPSVWNFNEPVRFCQFDNTLEK